MKQSSFLIFLFFMISGSLYVNAQPNEMAIIRDSFNAIQYSIPTMPALEEWKVIQVRTQSEWDNMLKTLKQLLEDGERNIEFRLNVKALTLPVRPKSIQNLNYPEANIRIVNNGSTLFAEGLELKRIKRGDVVFSPSGRESNLKFWVAPYREFGVDDMIVDAKGDEVSFRGEMLQVKGDIIQVEGLGTSDDIWKFEVDLPDLSEEECRDFYVLMTQDWTSARHKVVKVKDGWLYYHWDSEDLHSYRNPNVDWIQYKVRPRYCLINSPVSDGLHIKDGKVYVPWKYKKIRICKGGFLVHVGGCRLNSLEVTGFNIKGLGKCPIGVYNSAFTTGMFVHHNNFINLSNLAISAERNENVIFSDNIVTNTRVGVAECGGKNNTIARNRLKNIGWMLNTRAIIGSGDGLHICDNVIEDFNYAAIAVGSRAATRDSVILNYIIERNLIRLNKCFTDNYISNTLSDGGAIYVGPSCTQGIIRNNVIENIKGINSNRGIFLDDGAKNLAIYGNLVINTDNSYDIDLRLCKTYAEDIPDHNMNNCVFHNVITGGYRFQDRGKGSRCRGGENLIVNIKKGINNCHGEKWLKVDVDGVIPDIFIDDCELREGKLFIPVKYYAILNNLNLSGLVKKYLKKNGKRH